MYLCLAQTVSFELPPYKYLTGKSNMKDCNIDKCALVLHYVIQEKGPGNFSTWCYSGIFRLFKGIKTKPTQFVSTSKIRLLNTKHKDPSL